jgi:two-component system chemotaxis sensor kinase CheA
MAKDPYRYFRIEAQELLQGLDEGFLELERGADEELIRRLMRQAHTFKGASRIVKRPDIADLAHDIEDLLSPHRETGGPVERAAIDGGIQLLDRIRSLLVSLGGARDGEGGPTDARAASENRPNAIRVAVGELDDVLESASEAQGAASALRREAIRIKGAAIHLRELLAGFHAKRAPVSMDGLPGEVERLIGELDDVHRRMVAGIDRVLGELGELRAVTSELRLVPAKILMTELERAVRDAARALDKEVDFLVTGSDTHIDAHVLAALRTALVHLVRNSVAHGIEDRVEREKTGKSTSGRIEISIERRGHRARIHCHDDGRGLDLELVRKTAIERGLIPSELAPSIDEGAVAELLLRGGISTSPTVTRISGRGVGLEAVRHSVEALKGEIAIRSVRGEGTTVEILVPLSLSAMPALAMEVDDTAVLIPLDSVRETLRVSTDRISVDADGERLVLRGEVVPFLPLRRALNRPQRNGARTQSAVVVEAEGRIAALGVDGLGASRSVIVRGIPDHAGAQSIVSGVAFDDDGTPQLVLAPAALVRSATQPVSVHDRPAASPVPPLLIVDDSLTTRMLEQSILESAGYEVDLAVSGEEALEKARRRRYGVLIVDIEMPGMNGFELLEKAREDPELRATPAILVTSRADAADKRRGRELGARAYIVKSAFDQNELLEAIRRLIG